MPRKRDDRPLWQRMHDYIEKRGGELSRGELSRRYAHEADEEARKAAIDAVVVDGGWIEVRPRGGNMTDIVCVVDRRRLPRPAIAVDDLGDPWTL